MSLGVGREGLAVCCHGTPSLQTDEEGTEA